MYDLAKSIIALRLSTRRACMCEGKGQTKKNTLSLKTKVLFLIAEGCCAREITACLMIAKTNLALLTRDMADEGLIVKTKGTTDHREVNFSLTQAGREYLDKRLSVIENNVASLDKDNAKNIIEAATVLLNNVTDNTANLDSSED